MPFTEANFENAILEIFRDLLGYEYLYGPDVVRDFAEPLCLEILEDALVRINPSIPRAAIDEAIARIRNIESGSLARKNARFTDMLQNGVAVNYFDGSEQRAGLVRLVDYDLPMRNRFTVANQWTVEERSVRRADIVVFVNGLPLVVVELKSPSREATDVSEAYAQLRNYMQEIPSLFVYNAFCVMSDLATTKAGTITAGEDRFMEWKTVDGKLEDTRYANFDVLFRGMFEKSRFIELLGGFICCSEKDGQEIKLLSAYHQFYAVRKAVESTLRAAKGDGRGGVFWHTQGSGKSLTMVMLAQAIILDKEIRNPKIILVTDRTDLDRQITGTFRKCQIRVENATTGSKLVELLNSKSDAVITTIINKFETAVRGIRTPLTDPNIFVLIDEGHRSQYGEMGIKMEKTLPNACFIAMTGTPLMKKEKNTARKFGGIIQPVYTVDQAVADKAVVPLLYEGRMVPQVVHEETIDRYFDKICGWMSDAQRADMKKKFSRADQLNQTQQRIYAIAWDISQHFRENWQGSKFKAQLVAPRKRIAILYKQYLDEIGIVSSEVLITSPDTREGEDEAFGETSNVEVAFWKRMMDEYGTAKKYEASIINRFKNSDKPEIIIVVDKLLTGFDEPRNTVLYLDRKLKDHTLLQAIARVNRVCEDKEFGYIIDYYGVLGSLNSALELYTDFDKEDLEGTYTDISEEVAKLPQKHAELWDLFKEVRNTTDFEAFGNVLREEDRRTLFYEKLRAFARTLKVALSSIVFHQNTPQEEVERYKHDLAFFMKLRNAVQERYSDTVDYKQYEGQIQKLIDTHIESGEVQVITDLVNIFDKERFAEEVEKISGKAAKADTIASRTAKYITENMDTDPAFYKKFSQMLKETISQYEQGRIDEAEYLTQATDLMNKVLNHTDSEIPDVLKDNNAARAYFGLSLEVYKSVIKPEQGLDLTQIALDTASRIDAIIRQHIFEKGTLIVDWPLKDRLVGMMKLDIEDYLIDEVKRKYDLSMTFDDMDAIIDRAVDVAQKWFR